MADGHINPANVPDIALKDGHSIPQVGLGVLRVDDEGVVPVVESALEAGYRHIDGAAGYDNEAGLARTLGVCNFMPADLKCLHEETGAWPAVNQIELHPTWQQREVVAFCKEHGIAVEAYSPMARGADLNAGNGIIEKIAAAHGVSPARVILRWHIENGTIIIPKSVHAARQKENLDLFGFELTAEEHAAIDALDGPTRAGHDPLTFTYA